MAIGQLALLRDVAGSVLSTVDVAYDYRLLHGLRSDGRGQEVKHP